MHMYEIWSSLLIINYNATRSESFNSQVIDCLFIHSAVTGHSHSSASASNGYSRMSLGLWTHMTAKFFRIVQLCCSPPLPPEINKSSNPRFFFSSLAYPHMFSDSFYVLLAAFCSDVRFMGATGCTHSP